MTPQFNRAGKQMDTGLRKDSRDIKQPGFDKIAMRCNEKIALRWRLLTGNSESEKKMTTSDDEKSADAKMTSDESSETMIEMTIKKNEVHGNLIPGDILSGEYCRGPV